MITDDDVIRLFEQADPARRPDRINGHVDGAGYLTALRQQRSIEMTLTEPPRTGSTVPSSRGRRWGTIGVAAASVALVVGLVAVLARDDDPPTPASPPPSAVQPDPMSTDQPSVENAGAAADATAIAPRAAA